MFGSREFELGPCRRIHEAVDYRDLLKLSAYMKRKCLLLTYAECKCTNSYALLFFTLLLAYATTAASLSDLGDEEKCLTERKWWCFLLSSIFTFLAGLLVVLLWRAFAFLCCRKEPELSPNDPKQKEQKANRQGKQEFEGTFMTEAKDWAGELISGQTTTGRILVSAPSGMEAEVYTRMCCRPIFSLFCSLCEWWM